MNNDYYEVQSGYRVSSTLDVFAVTYSFPHGASAEVITEIESHAVAQVRQHNAQLLDGLAAKGVQLKGKRLREIQQLLFANGEGDRLQDIAEQGQAVIDANRGFKTGPGATEQDRKLEQHFNATHRRS